MQKNVCNNCRVFFVQGHCKLKVIAMYYLKTAK